MNIFGNNIGWMLIKALWPLLALIVAVGVFSFFFDVILPDTLDAWRIKRQFREGENWRSDRALLRWLRGMKPSEFERYVANLFTRLGYKTQVVGGSHDGGIDVEIEKDGIKSYIQCKKFIIQQVPVGAVRDFYGALVDHVAGGKGYFVTTNKFTLEAERFTEDKPIELIDGFGLIKYIRMTEK
jgi:HJR/Mrr/RecB family endonuclease